MIIGVTQAAILPQLWGFDHPLTWVVAVIVGLLVGTALARCKAQSSPNLGVSSFIVSLGGLLIWRGAAWWVTTGQTVAPLDSRFKPIGGGIEGCHRANASWAIAL